MGRSQQGVAHQCPKCGGEFSNKRKVFCPHCGVNMYEYARSLNKTERLGLDQSGEFTESYGQEGETPQGVCPRCDKDDAVWKLSSVVEWGSASGTFSGPSVSVTRMDGKWGTTGGYTSLSGSTKTELARMLEPPAEPAKPGGLGCLDVLFYLGVMIICATMAGTGLVLGIMAVGDSNESLTARVLLFLFLLGVSVIGFVGLFQTFKYFEKNHRKKKKQSAARYAEEKPAWDAAMRKYRRSYYCFRDGIVFDPETGTACDPSRLVEYLYLSS